MQPVKIAILGNYWDSQIYSGRLYLFKLDGSLTIIDWDRLIAEFPIEDELKIALECAFKNSEYFYGQNFKRFFADKEVKNVVEKKFIKLGDKELVLNEKDIYKYVISEKNNPLPFPHSDVTLYKNHIYSSSRDGLYCTTIGKKLKYGFNRNIKKKWDAPAISISALYKSLAIAAGDEGLFELKIDNSYWEIGSNLKDPVRLHSKNAIACDWNYYSIYSSSHIGGGALASYRKYSSDILDYGRELECIIDESKIFNNRGYSWGSRDKLCLAKSGEVHIVRYKPWLERIEEKLEHLGVVKISGWKGDVVSGAIGLFGSIIECDNCIIIATTDGSIYNFPGEPVRWRVFTRSKYYTNHLHIIYDDGLTIYSFNHDYFVDQNQKMLGVKHCNLQFKKQP